MMSNSLWEYDKFLKKDGQKNCFKQSMRSVSILNKTTDNATLISDLKKMRSYLKLFLISTLEKEREER